MGLPGGARPKVVVKVDEEERFERFALFGTMATLSIVMICAIALFAWRPWNGMSNTLSAGLTPTALASPSATASASANPRDFAASALSTH